jgi:hypothetical protein
MGARSSSETVMQILKGWGCNEKLAESEGTENVGQQCTRLELFLLSNWNVDMVIMGVG